jgi:WD40 repeat protein
VSSGGVVCALAVQGGVLASGGTDNLIEIWDLLTELVFAILETGRMHINALAFPSQPVKNERLILSLRI